MAIADIALDLVQGFEKSKGRRLAATKPGFFRRLLLALQASRRAQAEREILRHMHLIGDIQDRADGPAALGRKTLPF